MLRILHQSRPDLTHVVRLEGTLRAGWIDACEQVLASVRSLGGTVALDLERVDYADEAGIRWIRQTIDQGAHVAACSGYLKTLLFDAPSTDVRS